MEINTLVNWCTENNILLYISKTKELIVDFTKKEAKMYTPVLNQLSWGGAGEQFYVLWHDHHHLGHHTSPAWFKEAQKRLYFQQKLRRAKPQSQILLNLCRGPIESILTGNITNWNGSSKPRRGRLYRWQLKPPRAPLVPSTDHQWHQWSEMPKYT